jgi:hypothetical protein
MVLSDDPSGQSSVNDPSTGRAKRGAPAGDVVPRRLREPRRRRSRRSDDTDDGRDSLSSSEDAAGHLDVAANAALYDTVRTAEQFGIYASDFDLPGSQACPECARAAAAAAGTLGSDFIPLAIATNVVRGVYDDWRALRKSAGSGGMSLETKVAMVLRYMTLLGDSESATLDETIMVNHK